MTSFKEKQQNDLPRFPFFSFSIYFILNFNLNPPPQHVFLSLFHLLTLNEVVCEFPAHPHFPFLTSGPFYHRYTRDHGGFSFTPFALFSPLRRRCFTGYFAIFVVLVITRLFQVASLPLLSFFLFSFRFLPHSFRYYIVSFYRFIIFFTIVIRLAAYTFLCGPFFLLVFPSFFSLSFIIG